MLASARTTKASFKLNREGVHGAPVPFVSLPSLECCLYGQGGFLHRRRLFSARQQQQQQQEDSVDSDDERILVFSNQCASLHGIRYSNCDSSSSKNEVSFSPTWTVVFGGRYLAFLNNVRNLQQPMMMLSIVQSGQEGTGKQVLMLPDWVMDCESTAPEVAKERMQLIMGLAHNTVQIWSVAYSAQHGSVHVYPQKVLCGATRSILYSMAFHCPTGQVAAGTVTNSILLWSFRHATTQNSFVKESHHLKGHQGVLHCVCFDTTGCLLASTSDDRSVRLWECSDSSSPNETPSWSLRWTAWGHSARGWAVAFSVMGVLSTGEDGTLRVWDSGTGAALGVLRGHSYQWIRTVDTFQKWVVTGANNGTLALYNVFDRIMHDRGIVDETVNDEGETTTHRSSRTTTTLPASWKATFPIPQDRTSCEQKPSRVDHINVSSKSDARTKKRSRKKLLAAHAVVGMEFFRFPLDNHPSLIVATREGSIFSLDIRTGHWKRRSQWKQYLDNEMLISGHKWEGCCMKIHPRLPIAAIGTTFGDVVLIHFGDGMVGNCKNLARQIVLPASKNRSVQRLFWAEDTTLVSFHVRTVIVWTIQSPDEITSPTLDSSTISPTIVFQIKSRGVPISGAFNAGKDKFLVGDTRGNIHLFCVSDVGSLEPLVPAATLWSAHKKEHVNCIIWVKEEKIVSVGNDGCVLESVFDGEGQLRPALYTAVEAFTAILHIWTFVDKGRAIYLLGGYMGNVFKIVESANGYEHFCFDTGGRQRTLSMFENHKFPRECLFAVKDGVSNISLSHYSDQWSDFPAKDNQPVSPVASSVGDALHGESIFDVCIFSVDPEGRILALLTGSEDCSSRISIYREGHLINLIPLPPQTSGVRAVCCSRGHLGEALLVVGGGKLTTQFFVFRGIPRDGKNISTFVRFIGYGRSEEKANQDQRINVARAVPVPMMNDHTHLVITGDSSGKCSYYLISETMNERPVCKTFFVSERPILSFEILPCRDFIFAFAGTTGGTILMFDISGFQLEHSHSSSFLEPLLSFRCHKVGTNSISALLLPGDDSDFLLIRISTVGDDQAITCCDLKLFLDANGQLGTLSIERKTTRSEASLSALKGVEWIDEVSFATVGYDQQLKFWSWLDLEVIECLQSSPTGVGDVNCFAFCEAGSKKSFAVGGAGVELFSVPSLY